MPQRHPPLFLPPRLGCQRAKGPAGDAAQRRQRKIGPRHTPAADPRYFHRYPKQIQLAPQRISASRGLVQQPKICHVRAKRTALLTLLLAAAASDCHENFEASLTGPMAGLGRVLRGLWSVLHQGGNRVTEVRALHCDAIRPTGPGQSLPGLRAAAARSRGSGPNARTHPGAAASRRKHRVSEAL